MLVWNNQASSSFSLSALSLWSSFRSDRSDPDWKLLSADHLHFFTSSKSGELVNWWKRAAHCSPVHQWRSTFRKNEKDRKRNNRDQNECQLLEKFLSSWKCLSHVFGQTPSVPCTPLCALCVKSDRHLMLWCKAHFVSSALNSAVLCSSLCLFWLCSVL